MTGHSMGCMISQRFLTEHSDYIAAMACTSHVIGANTIPSATSVTPTPVLILQGMLDTDTDPYGRWGATPNTPSIVGIPWGPGMPYDQISSLESIMKLATMMGCTAETPPDSYNATVAELGAAWPTDPATLYWTFFKGTNCADDVAVELIGLIFCGHEAYLDFPVSTPGDVASDVQPCKVDTNAVIYSFLAGKVSAAAPTLGAAVVETAYPSGGCGGGCIGGIIGGCFVPVLLCILWMGGAFKKKAKAPKDGVTMTNIDTAAKAEAAAPA